MVIINGVFSYATLEVSEVCHVTNISIRCEDCSRKVPSIVELQILFESTWSVFEFSTSHWRFVLTALLSMNWWTLSSALCSLGSRRSFSQSTSKIFTKPSMGVTLKCMTQRAGKHQLVKLCVPMTVTAEEGLIVGGESHDWVVIGSWNWMCF